MHPAKQQCIMSELYLSQVNWGIHLTWRGGESEEIQTDGIGRGGGKDPSYCDLFWHQPSLVYISLSPRVKFLHTVNHADKVGCSCDAENVSFLLFFTPHSFCQIKTDMAAQGKVRCKLTETWATNHQWQVLRRVVVFEVIVCYLREREEAGMEREREREESDEGEKEKQGQWVEIQQGQEKEMTECWACSLWAHWTNMHAANCTVHGAQGQDYPICKTYYKATAVISPIWVMLINCVVTVITDDGWPHMSLIISWHRKTQFLQGTSANQDGGGETKIFTCTQEYTNLSAVVVLTQKVPVTPP